MKRRIKIVFFAIVLSGLVVLGVVIVVDWPSFWLRNSTAKVLLNGKPWKGSCIVRSQPQPQKIFIFKESGESYDGFVVDFKRRVVTIQHAPFWHLFGLVLPRKLAFEGVLYSKDEAKVELDPHLIFGPGDKSFSFSDEQGNQISVNGLRKK